jgi:hypothetical protein
MTDAELIERFESHTLPDEGFHHRDHVRLTFAYLRRFPVTEVLNRLSAGLAALARSRGRPERYHETITWAFVFLIRERLARSGCELSWQDFAAQHADLLNWNESVLRTYYREETLFSDIARTGFVLPDRLST